LSRDPFADIRITIQQPNARGLAPGEKVDTILTCQRHITNIERNAAASIFRSN
jgi:hypothetical protein